ncbi:MBL fold metallo-hydrolase [Cellulomonas fimi]|uniref:Beta-lactamase domain protein n=1 Tax=Cellulomonas fimi (strain ATCC 484 / DSM 20113 / JCM 1341 / CCUG 24087 / LMG 16345 / NBRC 15513 / NCIMB 8980 / NCTC 7547 / NRS-133) TaxID=590998 RepID=F4H0A4_CELFA|nr:MBL fold metallo-hydrolase [Cellulomonas fimi]AEE46151.1 beta-lactamase domain protein [Cellulomonas fimi ATCC 484]NNH07062.1 MBL fold metallo-hydrolase [Cellulomonas fimi]VEH31838.1 hydroxyacylglutathione hydrolase [Cellulomonas fimi]
MELLTLVSPVLGARCTVVVASDGACVVVDPGAGVTDAVVAAVAERGLRPAAVLVTHGHADHAWDAGPLSAALDVPVRVHAADAYRLEDPFGTLGVLGGAAPHDPTGPLASALAQVGVDPRGYRPPEHVETFGDAGPGRSEDVTWAVGDVTVVARHAPGHTEGSTLYLLHDGAARPVALTGDVLFAGTIGRTDLPGGDGPTMERTLREVVAVLDPRTVVLPGHGPGSDVATELATNPYLAPAR